eukprot:9934899-Heterocapsa_arctica.AAC.2
MFRSVVIHVNSNFQSNQSHGLAIIFCRHSANAYRLVELAHFRTPAGDGADGVHRGPRISFPRSLMRITCRNRRHTPLG